VEPETLRGLRVEALGKGSCFLLLLSLLCRSVIKEGHPSGKGLSSQRKVRLLNIARILHLLNLVGRYLLGSGAAAFEG
jgi:hypothetical protein